MRILADDIDDEDGGSCVKGIAGKTKGNDIDEIGHEKKRAKRVEGISGDEDSTRGALRQKSG